jgi:hypothetical protein
MDKVANDLRRKMRGWLRAWSAALPFEARISGVRKRVKQRRAANAGLPTAVHSAADMPTTVPLALNVRISRIMTRFRAIDKSTA